MEALQNLTLIHSLQSQQNSNPFQPYSRKAFETSPLLHYTIPHHTQNALQSLPALLLQRLRRFLLFTLSQRQSLPYPLSRLPCGAFVFVSFPFPFIDNQPRRYLSLKARQPLCRLPCGAFSFPCLRLSLVSFPCFPYVRNRRKPRHY